MYIHPYKKNVSCIYSFTVLIGLFVYFSMFSLGVFRKVCLLQCFAPISGYVCALFSTHAPTRGSTAAPHQVPQQQPSGEEVELGVAVGPLLGPIEASGFSQRIGILAVDDLKIH